MNRPPDLPRLPGDPDPADSFTAAVRFARAAVARLGAAGVDMEVASYPDGRVAIILPFPWARVYLETLQAMTAAYNEKLRRAAYQETIRRAEARARLREAEPPKKGMRRQAARSPDSPDALARLWATTPAESSPQRDAAYWKRHPEEWRQRAREITRDWEIAEGIRRQVGYGEEG